MKNSRGTKEKKEEPSTVKLPFHRTSVIGAVVRLALRSQGVTHKEIQTVAKKTGASAQRLFHVLRQGGLASGKMTWELEENPGRIKIVNYKVV